MLSPKRACPPIRNVASTSPPRVHSPAMLPNRDQSSAKGALTFPSIKDTASRRARGEHPFIAVRIDNESGKVSPLRRARTQKRALCRRNVRAFGTPVLPSLSCSASAPELTTPRSYMSDTPRKSLNISPPVDSFPDIWDTAYDEMLVDMIFSSGHERNRKQSVARDSIYDSRRSNDKGARKPSSTRGSVCSVVSENARARETEVGPSEAPVVGRVSYAADGRVSSFAAPGTIRKSLALEIDSDEDDEDEEDEEENEDEEGEEGCDEDSLEHGPKRRSKIPESLDLDESLARILGKTSRKSRRSTKMAAPRRKTLEALLEEEIHRNAVEANLHMASSRRSSIATVDTMRADLMKGLRKNMVRVQDVFRSMDQDGSGTLERSEFIHGVASYFGDTYSKDEIAALFDSLDHDGSREISYVELQDIFKDTSRRSAGRPAQVEVKSPKHISLQKAARRSAQSEVKTPRRCSFSPALPTTASSPQLVSLLKSEGVLKQQRKTVTVITHDDDSKMVDNPPKTKGRSSAPFLTRDSSRISRSSAPLLAREYSRGNKLSVETLKSFTAAESSEGTRPAISLWKKAIDNHQVNRSTGSQIQSGVQSVRQRELKELLEDFKAQHRAGVCKVPTFRQLIRLHYPTTSTEEINLWMQYVKGLEAAAAEKERLHAMAEMRKRQIETMFNSLDTEGRGSIDLQEFMQLRDKSAALDEEKLCQIFNEQDKEGTGVIELHEFQQIVEEQKLLEFFAVVIDDGTKNKKREPDQRLGHPSMGKVGLSQRKHSEKSSVSKRPSLLDVQCVLHSAVRSWDQYDDDS